MLQSTVSHLNKQGNVTKNFHLTKSWFVFQSMDKIRNTMSKKNHLL